MQKKNIIRIIILVLILIWMLTVFSLSNQNGNESSGLSRKIASLITSNDEVIEKIEPYIRKIAHLTEYAIGGVLFISFFLTYPFSDKKRMLFSLLIGIEYAAIDEIHQLFIEGRAGKITDVLIDSIGVAIGICLVMVFYKIIMLHKGKECD